MMKSQPLPKTEQVKGQPKQMQVAQTTTLKAAPQEIAPVYAEGGFESDVDEEAPQVEGGFEEDQEEVELEN